MIVLASLVWTLTYACGSSVAPTSPVPCLLVDASATDASSGALEDAHADVRDSAVRPRALFHRGVNLSGGEFGACCPGRLGIDYGYPSRQDVDLMALRGVNHLRVPFRMERLQPKLQGPIDEAEWTRYFDAVAYAVSKGMTVAIEPHNFGRYNDVVLTEIQIGDFWGRIVQRFLASERIWPDLMNEPHDMPTETWLKLAQASIREIRRVGFHGRVLVPGNGWDGAGSWAESWYGTPNAIAMVHVTDANSVFEAHLYLDKDASGKGSECVSETIGVERLQPFMTWLKQHARMGYLGEIGAPNTARCAKAVRNALAALEAEPTLWIGWAWWSAGRRWTLSYPMTLQPILFDAGAGVEHLGADRPQMEWVRPFFYRNANAD